MASGVLNNDVECGYRGVEDERDDDTARSHFKLNHFFSTEPVTRSHITTGTVFFCKEQGEYYVIATPACDLEPRLQAQIKKWAHSIHPFTPFTAIHLNLDDKGLTNAANGKHIFLNKPKEQAFRIVNGTSQQPTYEYFFR